MDTDSTRRVKLSQSTKDWLWSESGGHCQNPECRADLHGFVERTHIGELAHIIPASTNGPRANDGPEVSSSARALPENIAVLCPTCHTIIDKDPEEYPDTRLHEWKQRSQEARVIAHGTPIFTSRQAARNYIEELLDENNAVFERYGPLNEVFDESRTEQWHRHAKKKIIPNNRTLLRVLQINRRLLTEEEKKVTNLFAIHAQEFEERHLNGDWTPGSTRFPIAMKLIMEDEK